MSSNNNIVIIGGNSYIAQNIKKSLCDKYQIVDITSKQLNLLDEDSICQSDNECNIYDKLLPKKISTILFTAGINPRSKKADQQTFTEMLQMLTVNIVGPVRFLSILSDKKMLCDNSNIIFFSSVAAFRGSNDAIYAASKAALHSGFLTSIRNTFKCRANAITLGLVNQSPIYFKILNEMGDQYINDRHASKMSCGLINAKDIVNTVEYIINTPSVDCCNIKLDGGMSN